MTFIIKIYFKVILTTDFLEKLLMTEVFSLHHIYWLLFLGICSGKGMFIKNNLSFFSALKPPVAAQAIPPLLTYNEF